MGFQNMVRYDLLLFMLKIETTTRDQIPKGSFPLRDNFLSSCGIISGLRIICGRGSFAALYCVVSLGRQWNILYEKEPLQLCFNELWKRQPYFYAKTWSRDVTWPFWRKFMAIRFFRIRLSVGRSPIQVLLIRSDPVWVLSNRSDPSWFCKHPSKCPRYAMNPTRKSNETCSRMVSTFCRLVWDLLSRDSWNIRQIETLQRLPPSHTFAVKRL